MEDTQVTTTTTSKKMKSKKTKSPKQRKRDVAFRTYLAMMIALVVFGFWDSEAAQGLLSAIREAFSLLIEFME